MGLSHFRLDNALQLQQKNFKLAKETLDELAAINQQKGDISAKTAGRLAAAQEKMANADPSYTIKNGPNDSFEDRVKHLAKHAMGKLNQTKQILANNYKIKIEPDTTDNQIIKIEKTFEQLIEDKEDELVMGNTPKDDIQSQLDQHPSKITNQAKIFSHPNKNGIEQDSQHNQQRDSQQKDALDDDGHDINHNFSTN
ncbi:MAG: hypothetical protein GY821_16965 [Gammaproteobacteria bacterium]|nr:hypothetical protein [Gammaproteobacteria bacterium]